MNEKIQAKLKLLPKTPGVYIMKDKNNEVIYVGKAISLKNRVSQYFHSIDKHLPKVRAMVVNIWDFDYVLCKSEMEALILESNLIKQFMPKYNILLKDDKHYPYVKIDFKKEYPIVEVVRKVKNDGCKYFGPFLNSSNLKKALEYVYEIYPVRTCKKDLTKNKDKRPCLNYQIGRCLGPCFGHVESKVYLENVNKVAEFLEGKTQDVIEKLKEKMQNYSNNLEFEKAGKIRDAINMIQTVVQNQTATISGLDDRDIIGIAKADDFAIVQLMIMRQGKIINSLHFKLELENESELDEILGAFVMQYYDVKEKIPREILMPFGIKNLDLYQEHLKKIATVKLIVPQKGVKKQMVLMAMKNAKENILKQKNDRQWIKTKGALIELCEILDIKGPITRMECYDISNTQGKDSVGSMVVFVEGKPQKKEYRRFRIKTVKGPNDVESISEIIERRFKRAIEEQREGIDGKFSDLPDLIVVDGGKTQVNAAFNTIERLGFSAIPIIGIAEKNEEIFLPFEKDPIIIDRRSNALKIIQAIRDEAHRFAITFHRSLRSKTSVSSSLDGIKGLGKVKKQELYKYFKSIEKIKSATVDQLLMAPKMDKTTAQNIFNFFNQESKDGEEC